MTRISLAFALAAALAAAPAAVAAEAGAPRGGLPSDAVPSAGGRYDPAMSPEALAQARIEAQIDALLTPPSGGFSMNYYPRPAPPPAASGAQGQPTPQAAAQAKLEAERGARSQPKLYVIAKPGDATYATIDRAFDSDDPQGPIFATVHDIDARGMRGPLDGVRLLGAITYSSSQAALQFNQAYLRDGRTLQLHALAISEDDARTGVAKDVDQHTIQRYGSLLLAGLIQGAGQAGQQLLQNNQQVSTDPTTGAVAASENVVPYQVALTALQPVGQVLTAAAARNFNQPATMTGPAGMGIGVVFLDPVAVPGDLIFRR